MIILGIETSCDETALALMEATGNITAPRFKILKNLVSSQIAIHVPFGGVVPNLGKREHLKNLPILYKKIASQYSHLAPDLIAVTIGPGLEPALWAGITYAQDLAKKLKVPLIGANHLEGHLYSFLLAKKTVLSNVEYRNSKLIKNSNYGNPKRLINSHLDIVSDFRFRASDLFPAVALIVSGGHTVLLLVKNLREWKTLGETRDDAAGEAFDKVARLLNLPYPGGPEISKLATIGNQSAVNFPRPMIHNGNYDFSFSGLKTSVLYYLREQEHDPNLLISSLGGIRNNSKDSGRLKADVAASFQQAVIDVLTAKTVRAANEFAVKSVMLSGGVAANELLRKTLRRESRRFGLQFLAAPHQFNTDNAAMIAVAGYLTYLRKKIFPLRANGNLKI
jgi:N6-L-threonylcarbamoyladenine synthase